jgi:hypothetical protein
VTRRTTRRKIEGLAAVQRANCVAVPLTNTMTMTVTVMTMMAVAVAVAVTMPVLMCVHIVWGVMPAVASADTIPAAIAVTVSIAVAVVAQSQPWWCRRRRRALRQRHDALARPRRVHMALQRR